MLDNSKKSSDVLFFSSQKYTSIQFTIMLKKVSKIRGLIDIENKLLAAASIKTTL